MAPHIAGLYFRLGDGIVCRYVIDKREQPVSKPTVAVLLASAKPAGKPIFEACFSRRDSNPRASRAYIPSSSELSYSLYPNYN